MSSNQNRNESNEEKSARISVSFPRDLYDTLEQLAKDKKVSVAWVVRDAAEKYVGDQWPFFEKRQENQ